MASPQINISNCTADERNGDFHRNVLDFWRIINGLEVYANLGLRETVERLRINSEDCLCYIRNASDSDDLQCTRDGYDAAYDLAERHINSLALPENYSAEDLAKAIRRNIARCFVEEEFDEPALHKLLLESTKEAEISHLSRIYHFPCVLVRASQPPHIQLGPVIFSHTAAFPELMKADFHNYVEQKTDKETAQEQIRTFQQFVQSAGWAATVRIPPAAESASRKRAEKTIMTAINLLRLVIGIPHSQDMRLAHFAGSPIHTQYASHEGSRLTFTTNRKLSGALVTPDWHAIFQHIPEFWHRASHLLSVGVEGKRSEMANRVIDALSWFGEAAFETEPGTKIVKFVAALERLVTTHKFSPHMFCTRVALLTRDPNNDNIEDCYWEADEVYRARCEIMHGASSPTDPKFLRHLLLAHNVTRTAIFRALEIHCVLDDNNGTSTVTDLNNYFVSQQSKWASKMGKLKTEIKKRKISKFQSGQQKTRM